MPSPVKLIFTPGDRYGRLVVLAEARLPNTPGRARHGMKQGPRGALCRCDCGNEEVMVIASSLASGAIRSCGCLRSEIAATRLPAMTEGNRTHGLAGRRSGKRHPLYDTWWGMMQRCYSEKHPYYHRYGGRGITVCPEWHDPAVFIAWIESNLGPRPKGMTLDRINNEAGIYEPGEVRWATQSQQMLNRTLTPKKALTPDQLAEAKAKRDAGATLQVLAEEYGLSIATIHRYLGNGGRGGRLRR